MYKTHKAFEKSFPRHYLGTDGIELEEYALVRHGRWIYKDDNYFICSCCRKYEHMLRPCWGLKKYCPNCGAKMDLEVQE